MSHEDFMDKRHHKLEQHAPLLPPTQAAVVEMPTVNIVIQLLPSSEVPTWAVSMQEQMALLLKDDEMTKKSTQDLLDAVAGLVDTVTKTDAAIEALQSAHEEDDSEAIEAAVGTLIGLKADLLGHLPTIAATIPPVVTAPADEPVVVPTEPAAPTE